MRRIGGVIVWSILLLIMVGCSGGGGSSDTSPKEMIDNTETNDSTKWDTLYESFNVGIGMDGAYPFSDGSDTPIWLSSADLIFNDKIDQVSRYQPIEKFDGAAFKELQSKLKKTKYVVYWISKYWEENWVSVDDIQSAMDLGYVPVFNYWYFADELAGGLPDADTTQEYYTHNQKVLKFLQKLKGKKIVIMEPEFNKNSVVHTPTQEEQETFAKTLAQAIDTLRGGTEDTLFSLSMMDAGLRSATDSHVSCGYSPCALGDKKMWDSVEPIYTLLLPKLDFLSFSEMVGQFSRDHDDPGSQESPNPRSYTNDELGIEYLDTRIINLSTYMNEKYHKPVFLSHITIATATWSDDNSNGAIEKSELDLSGWEDVAEDFYLAMMDRKEELYQSGLFGFAVMKLFDDPQHDINGYQISI